MMKAAPAATFVVTQSKLLLQILIIAFDTPTHPGHQDELFRCRLPGHRPDI